MKLNDIEYLASLDDSAVKRCRIIEQNSESITFEVDEGLKIASEHYPKFDSKETIERILETEQIGKNRNNVIDCSFKNEMISDIGGNDVLFKCIIESYGQHRPLVLSPDMIWLIIAQTLAKHINENSELYRNNIVSHNDKMDIIVEADKDLLTDHANWTSILDGFYDKIENKTKNRIAHAMVADFSTTGVNERIVSISTLMNGVQSYFRYEVWNCICGIPYITLKGTKEDWEKLSQKISFLNNFGLSTWYEWLKPIMSEFVRTVSGTPNSLFWKNIVCTYTPTYISTRRTCIPNETQVDGWCVALFPHTEYIETDDGYEEAGIGYDTTYALRDLESEILRTAFKYIRLYPDGTAKTFPMELWSGIIGVEEDENTFALTPKIGWFVRQSEEEQESLDRLKGANDFYGIDLTIDEVPEILNRLNEFNSLTLRFTGKAKIPNWLYTKSVNNLYIYGDVDNETKLLLRKAFSNVNINNDDFDDELDTD